MFERPGCGIPRGRDKILLHRLNSTQNVLAIEPDCAGLGAQVALSVDNVMRTGLRFDGIQRELKLRAELGLHARWIITIPCGIAPISDERPAHRLRPVESVEVRQRPDQCRSDPASSTT